MLYVVDFGYLLSLFARFVYGARQITNSVARHRGQVLRHSFCCCVSETLIVVACVSPLGRRSAHIVRTLSLAEICLYNISFATPVVYAELRTIVYCRWDGSNPQRFSVPIVPFYFSFSPDGAAPVFYVSFLDWYYCLLTELFPRHPRCIPRHEQQLHAFHAAASPRPYVSLRLQHHTDI
jgi:hypothetical protein